MEKLKKREEKRATQRAYQISVLRVEIKENRREVKKIVERMKKKETESKIKSRLQNEAGKRQE